MIPEISPAIKARDSKGPSSDGDGDGAPLIPIAFDCKGTEIQNDIDVSPTVRAMSNDQSHANGGGQLAVAFESRIARNGRGKPEHITPPLKAQSGKSGKGDSAPLIAGAAVRRLTPRECERLQGFPDDFTLVPLPLKHRQSRQRWASDGARYKALGNSMAVPCVRWLGERIQLVDQMIKA